MLIDVHAASVSFMDCLMVSGKYQMKPATPFVPGTDAAGIVRAVGPGVTGFEPGDRVACSHWTGAYAEVMSAPDSKAVHIPEGVDFDTASTVLHTYKTALYALECRAAVRPGETVFVTGAAGGVGLSAVDFARYLGARVIAGVGSDGKVELVKRYGATAVVNYRAEPLRDRIKALTDGKGVDVCFDNVGGDVFTEMTRLMNWGGRLMPIGFASGEISSVPMNLPLLKNYSIVGVVAGAWSEKFPIESATASERLMQLVATKALNPHVDRVFPLDGVTDAMTSVANRAALGRLVLRTR
ncbi:NADPH:quinone oxidoreductase family protein [Piscinibacter sp.]|uniref:NADPH:quinone oxidoreductase family protein n=1 Tax=Piscinibacter sp. TaxID=1903157 RepID=UPI002CC79492|nr:NADPH:quinone oxidoreductase family protein [Albitalea sp.]HUG21547.1 NADPH:quinone oxidoreductase family protein [Albitalea sp.]